VPNDPVDRSPREIVDLIDEILLVDGTVPRDLVADLIAALPRYERECWIAMLLATARLATEDL
jgi:hypothetical protein